MSELNHLMQQLNLLIGFLDVSDIIVYEEIKNHDKYELGLTIDDLYENNFNNFQNHITTSALILGFTHFEDFLTKITIKTLIKFPNKNKIKFTIERLDSIGENFKLFLAEEQAKRLTFSDKIKLQKSIFSNIDDLLVEKIKFVNNIRNCLMHNNGYADDRLQPQYSIGEKIILTSLEINQYGLMARNLANMLWFNFNQ